MSFALASSLGVLGVAFLIGIWAKLDVWLHLRGSPERASVRLDPGTPNRAAVTEPRRAG